MKKNIPEHIGKRIKKIRSFNGMTQEELALAINKTRSMVSHIERTGDINYYTLKEIATALKLPIEQLQNEDQIIYKIEEENKVCKDQTSLIQLQNEINFLKETINNQWKLLFALSK